MLLRLGVMRWPGFVLLCACAIACGSTGDVSNDAGADAQTEASTCYALYVPASWRACTSTADCQVGWTITNCCGMQRTTGIAKASLTSFDQAEIALENRCPQCGCEPGPMTADDGTTSRSTNPPSVSCKTAAGAGVCTTSYSASDAGEAGTSDAQAD